MKRLFGATTVLFGLLAISGCSNAPNPPGTGASGKPLEIAPDTGVPEEVKNPLPGSGMGGGPGDGTGRERFPDKAGKADHEPGTGTKKRKEKEAKKEAPAEAAPAATSSEPPTETPKEEN